MTQSIFNTLGQLGQRWITAVVGGLLTFTCVTGHAEQVHRFAGHEVHYIIIPTTFLESEIAAQYDVARARNRALINVSILDANKEAVTGSVSGSSSNLLGQTQYFEFRQVREGDAITISRRAAAFRPRIAQSYPRRCLRHRAEGPD